MLNNKGESVEKSNGTRNKVNIVDYPIHNWYRFVLSFPPHLVREYIQKFNLTNQSVILDPFCGTGTTIVEAKLNNINSIGVEINPMAHFASHVKTIWDMDLLNFKKISIEIAHKAQEVINNWGTKELLSLDDDKLNLLITNSISPIPLHKSLILLDEITRSNSAYLDHNLLAFATSTVKNASNLHFGPEVGVSKKKKIDVDVVQFWLDQINLMIKDLGSINQNSTCQSQIFKADARRLLDFIEPKSIDAVFTSPPYPNEKDYTRTTRLESVMLDFLKSKGDLRLLKNELLRSNTRNVYKGDSDDDYILRNDEVQQIAKEIEKRRIALGKTSGFERLYYKVTKLYFGGMARHLENLKPVLKKNAMLGYVVGDQASYLQVHIPTGKILGDIATDLGYELVNIDLFRTRFATAIKLNMNEEVLVLKWKG